VESFFPLLKAGSSGIHYADPDCENKGKPAIAVKFQIFETDERTHYPAFAECVFVLKTF
jgi:hypothetical protein